MSRARIIFDDLTRGDAAERWARIERLVADHETESLWLDFKEVRQPNALPDEDYLKKKLARAISGFANTEGGVVVYGIYAKEGKKGEPDAAENITPIASPAKFRAALEKLSLTLTDPVVGGLVVEEVVKPSTDEGVVVLFVPESNGAPHRIVSTNPELNDRYMMRTATSVVVMPHRHLADRFSRTAPPLLELTARFKSLGPAVVEFLLKNVGRGAARRPAVEIVHPISAFHEPMRSSSDGFAVRAQARVGDDRLRSLVEARIEAILYPGLELPILQWATRLAGPQLELPMEFRLHALDMQPVVGSGKLFVGVGELQEVAMGRILKIPSDVGA